MRTRARAPTCPLATLLSFCPVFRFAPPFPTVRTSLLLSDDVCRQCNLACDRLFTLMVKFLHAPFWRPCTLAPGDICTPLPPLRYASGDTPRIWQRSGGGGTTGGLGVRPRSPEDKGSGGVVPGRQRICMVFT